MLIVMILIAVAVAVFFPAQGEFANTWETVTTAAIACLFFLYGARLSPSEAVAGLKHWRLHTTILIFTYVVFPLIGLALFPLHNIIGDDLYAGVVFLCLVPSTVQSSVAFTSIARGNIAGSIVSASTSNLVGVVVTPVLVMFFMSDSGFHISATVFIDVALQLLVPFIIGQAARMWRPVTTIAASPLTKNVDRLSIAFVVYGAFSHGIVLGVWTSIAWWQLAVVVVLSLAMVEVMLWLTWTVAHQLGFDYGDRVAIQFCGTKKSLATGLPMAAVMFPHSATMIILPLMVFHQIQLMVCSVRASRYARRRACHAEPT
ncbi:bile acid:sodium symporter family protein [Corynebacterium kroppenstedtii]|uniref:bile acid:sodium symporter family protein n=1 Tax=Corynebacterium sp. PCR 32 TaxID=3351342 RepID=UPI0030A13768